MSERIYTVRVGKQKLKEFTSKAEAQKFMVEFAVLQQLKVQQLDYLNEAVLKSDLSESKAVLKYIMEKK
jgi:hypothetical protein